MARLAYQASALFRIRRGGVPLSCGRGTVCRIAAPGIEELLDLQSLLVPAESVWIAGTGYPPVAGLALEQTLECVQMVLPVDIAPPAPAVEIVSLSSDDAPEMVALTDLAFPGFFRKRTCAMGSYFGVRSHGQLIAMGGERLTIENYPEISGISTHPDHRGKGYAESLIWQLVRTHRRLGMVSWLHVNATNNRAIGLRRIMLHRVSRRDSGN